MHNDPFSIKGVISLFDFAQLLLIAILLMKSCNLQCPPQDLFLQHEQN